jgi:hypothetical protein
MGTFVIEGILQANFRKEIEADSLEDADYIADELLEEEIEDEDIVWPPYSIEIIDVSESE